MSERNVVLGNLRRQVDLLTDQLRLANIDAANETARANDTERELALASPVIEAAREINEWEDHPHLEAALAAYNAAREEGEGK
jgi:hypothetical protein